MQGSSIIISGGRCPWFTKCHSLYGHCGRLGNSDCYSIRRIIEEDGLGDFGNGWVHYGVYRCLDNSISAHCRVGRCEVVVWVRYIMVEVR